MLTRILNDSICAHHQTILEREIMTFDQQWDALVSMGVSTQTLHIVTALNGKTAETMEDILYVHTGYRSFEQLDDERP